jgi:CxxC-x17-CxxC domain-containing protein
MGKFNNDRREGGFNGNRGGRPSFGGRGGGFGGARRDDRGPVTMHDATCDECKRPCQVPFRPTGDRPIYCKNCFDKRGGGREAGRFAGAAGNVSPEGFSQNDLKTQLAMINIKLDKVMKALDLGPKSTPAPVVIEEEVAEKPKKVVKSKKVSKK